MDGRLRVGEFIEAVRVGDCASATVSKSRFATIALVLPCVIGRDRTPPIVFLRLGLSGDDMFDRKNADGTPRKSFKIALVVGLHASSQIESN